jgi:hypothetical protein
MYRHVVGCACRAANWPGMAHFTAQGCIWTYLQAPRPQSTPLGVVGNTARHVGAPALCGPRADCASHRFRCRSRSGKAVRGSGWWEGRVGGGVQWAAVGCLAALPAVHPAHAGCPTPHPCTHPQFFPTAG